MRVEVFHFRYVTELIGHVLDEVGAKNVGFLIELNLEAVFLHFEHVKVFFITFTPETEGEILPVFSHFGEDYLELRLALGHELESNLLYAEGDPSCDQVLLVFFRNQLEDDGPG